ncbi:MAG: ferric reductase-like transmembrane domain-containing protein [Stigonema ocellatum SAG 48.90 = DSM 106950]|nr:ferric reductase-like transmembrane domain-containing protein [Stigonema ocellatum SAG 48.90 = DSM 106950]
MVTMNVPVLADILGFIALIGYIFTLLPTILRIVFPRTKQTGIPKLLLKQRRLIGIMAFFLSLAHGYLLVRKRNIDFFDLKTYWIYSQGVSTFIILTLLTLTSNDWSIKKLKKNWKQLHQLTYVAMFLLIWHIWDKMSGHWTYLTPIGIVGITGITVLFLIRLWIEAQDKQQKIKGKELQAKKQAEGTF